MKERSYSHITTNFLIVLALSKNGSRKWGARQYLSWGLSKISKKVGEEERGGIYGVFWLHPFSIVSHQTDVSFFTPLCNAAKEP